AADGGEGATFINTSIPRTVPPQPSPSGNYYGGPSFTSLTVSSPPSSVKIADPKAGVENEYRVQQTNLDREWRTPPLWGLADSAPYLHDGRAATLLEAIALHTGQGARAATAFTKMLPLEQTQLVEFLQTLRAP